MNMNNNEMSGFGGGYMGNIDGFKEIIKDSVKDLIYETHEELLSDIESLIVKTLDKKQDSDGQNNSSFLEEDKYSDAINSLKFRLPPTDEVFVPTLKSKDSEDNKENKDKIDEFATIAEEIIEEFKTDIEVLFSESSNIKLSDIEDLYDDVEEVNDYFNELQEALSDIKSNVYDFQEIGDALDVKIEEMKDKYQ